MRRTVAAAILALGAGCDVGSEPVDPLDLELVRELALAQGTASGDARSGSFTLQLDVDRCDCPSFDYQGQTVDLCLINDAGNIHAELTEGSGVLVIANALGLFTGAIEADGSFITAGIADLSTIAGPLESVQRMDGQFASDSDSAEGWVGQRLIGEVPGQSIDCRWIGSFALTRN